MHKNKIKHALLNTSMKEMGNNCENTQYNVLDKISQPWYYGYPQNWAKFIMVERWPY